MPVPELAPDPGQRVLHCHVNWVKTHLHNTWKFSVQLVMSDHVNSTGTS